MVILKKKKSNTLGYLCPRRHRPQRQGARQPEHSGSDEDAEHVGGGWPCHHVQIRGQQHHAPGNATLQSGQNDAGDPSATLFDSGVRHVRERRDVGHLVGHQHVMSPCQEAGLTAVTEASRRADTRPSPRKTNGTTKPWGVFQTSIPVDSPSCA